MKKNVARVLSDGAIGGFIAYALISAYFAAFNVLTGHSAWRTLQTLSDAVFASPGPPQMIAFNGVHMVAFLVLGVIAAFMIQELEVRPAFWYVAFFVSTIGFMLGYVLLSLATSAMANLSPTTVLLGNLIAAIGMGAFLVYRQRQIAT